MLHCVAQKLSQCWSGPTTAHTAPAFVYYHLPLLVKVAAVDKSRWGTSELCPSAE